MDVEENRREWNTQQGMTVNDDFITFKYRTALLESSNDRPTSETKSEFI